jgi:hypothetical protein
MIVSVVFAKNDSMKESSVFLLHNILIIQIMFCCASGWYQMPSSHQIFLPWLLMISSDHWTAITPQNTCFTEKIIKKLVLLSLLHENT